MNIGKEQRVLEVEPAAWSVAAPPAPLPHPDPTRVPEPAEEIRK